MVVGSCKSRILYTVEIPHGLRGTPTQGRGSWGFTLCWRLATIHSGSFKQSHFWENRCLLYNELWQWWYHTLLWHEWCDSNKYYSAKKTRCGWGLRMVITTMVLVLRWLCVCVCVCECGWRGWWQGCLCACVSGPNIILDKLLFQLLFCHGTNVCPT